LELFIVIVLFTPLSEECLFSWFWNIGCIPHGNRKNNKNTAVLKSDRVILHFFARGIANGTFWDFFSHEKIFFKID